MNSQEVSYQFGQLGSAHMHNAAANSLTPPDGMVIIAITMLDATTFDVLTPDTSSISVAYSGTESNEAFFGVGSSANTSGNSEAVDNSIVFPGGVTIYGRWTAVSIVATQGAGGIICYFGK
jgi:hypothetical protein